MSARSRGAAPSMDMLNRPVQVGDLENLRVVDLRALAKNMGVQLKSNMRKAEIISSLSGAMGGRSVMLDREVAAVSSSGNARSRGAASSSMNAADTDRFLQDLVLGANQMTGDTYEGYRTKWQYLVSKVTGRFGVNAAEAARMLGPYYTSERSRGSSSPRSRSPSRNDNFSQLFMLKLASPMIPKDYCDLLLSQSPMLQGEKASIFFLVRFKNCILHSKASSLFDMRGYPSSFVAIIRDYSCYRNN